MKEIKNSEDWGKDKDKCKDGNKNEKKNKISKGKEGNILTNNRCICKDNNYGDSRDKIWKEEMLKGRNKEKN